MTSDEPDYEKVPSTASPDGQASAGPASTPTSLEMVESLIGCTLDETEAERLANSPEDQLADYLSKFAPAWFGWFEQSALRDRVIAGKPIYMAPGIGANSEPGLSLADYKRAALCFSEVAIADPLAALLHAPILMAHATDGMWPVELTQHAFRAGIRRLAQIAPLVRTGALVLVPDIFCNDHPSVQEHARKEVDLAPATDNEFPAQLDLDDFALATAIATHTQAWPVATRMEVFERMERGILTAATTMRRREIEVAKALARFGLPDAGPIPIELLLEVRAGEASFADFRNKLSTTMIRAYALAKDDPLHFSTFLRDELEGAAHSCREAAKMSSAIDGAVAPALTTLLLAATRFVFESVNLSDPKELARLTAELAAPGAVWLAMQMIRRLTSANVRENRRLAELYGCLMQNGNR